MRKLAPLIPIVLLSGAAIFWGWQHSRSEVAARTDYDDANATPRLLIRQDINNSIECSVAKVIDGDTINVSCGGQKKRVRLCGIDAPETEHGSKAGQPLGEESKAMLKQLINTSGGKVSLDVIEQDRYGRDVAEVWDKSKGGDRAKLLNADLVMAGMAYDYRKYSGRCPNAETLDTAESIAKEKRLGVWDGKRYEYPWDFRRAQRN